MKEIVIKIPDKVYESVIEEGFSVRNARELIHAMVNGKVLPKGHHELIDRYDLMNAYRGSNNIFEALQKTDVIIEADEDEQ